MNLGNGQRELIEGLVHELVKSLTQMLVLSSRFLPRPDVW